MAEPKYSVVAIYAEDWNTYTDQHSPSDGSDYRVARGWLAGFLIEEKDDHLVIAHTCFDPGDVRYAVVVPKRSIIQRIDKCLNKKEGKHD